MAALPDDLMDFYNADLGPTVQVDLSDTVAQSSDDDGPLPPGRYLIQVAGLALGTTAWIKLVPYIAAESVSIDAQVPNFPFAATGAIEVNIRKGISDRAVGILDIAGTATLYITQMSRPRSR